MKKTVSTKTIITRTRAIICEAYELRPYELPPALLLDEVTNLARRKKLRLLYDRDEVMVTQIEHETGLDIAALHAHLKSYYEGVSA